MEQRGRASKVRQGLTCPLREQDFLRTRPPAKAHFKTLLGPGCPCELQSRCLCGPLSSPCQVWASPSRGAQECLFNESLGASPLSPPRALLQGGSEERGVRAGRRVFPEQSLCEAAGDHHDPAQGQAYAAEPHFPLSPAEAVGALAWPAGRLGLVASSCSLQTLSQTAAEHSKPSSL